MTTDIKDIPGVAHGIDQLWYTSSSFGLRGSLGFQVRAASRDLLDKNSPRFERVSRLLYYYLPQGATPYNTTPAEAPVCMVFTRSGGEKLLAHKAYVGKDPIGRPGNFFVHLLAGLPEDFTARQAIRLWGVFDLWRRAEGDLDQRTLELDPVPHSALTPVGERHFNPDQPGVAACPRNDFEDYLAYAIEAYLSLASLAPGKRLFIAAPPDTVAALIMGMVEALPHQVLADMTFSTYEQDVAHSSDAMIVGTCVLNKTDDFDLPASCDGDAGLMLNCYSGKRSKLPQGGALTGYAQFAARCLMSGNIEELRTFLVQGGITDLRSLISIFKLYQLNTQGVQDVELEEQDITYMLKSPGLARSYLASEHAQSIHKEIVRLAQDDAWWSEIGQGALTALSSNVDGDPPLRRGLSELAQYALLVAGEGWQDGYVAPMSRLLDGLIATVDASLAYRVWQHSFSHYISDGPDHLSSIEQRLWLLQGWAKLPEAASNEQVIAPELLPWLLVPWSDLDKFLERMPDVWRPYVVFHAICLGADDMHNIKPHVVEQHSDVFQQVFQHMMDNAEKALAAVRFFAKLVALEYTKKIPLMSAILQGLLTIPSQNIDEATRLQSAEDLLRNARLSSAELSEFLESQIGQTLPTLLPVRGYSTYVRRYLDALGVADLERATCRTLLSQLSGKSGLLDKDLVESAGGWYWIANLLQHVEQIVRNRQHALLSRALRFFSKIPRKEDQNQVQHAIVAALVGAVRDKEDVVWIMSEAARHREAVTHMGGESQLLGQMISLADESAANDESYVAALMPYIEFACSRELSEPARSLIESIIQVMPQPMFKELEKYATKWHSSAANRLAAERKRRTSATARVTFWKKH
jgi:hypothetical protein